MNDSEKLDKIMEYLIAWSEHQSLGHRIVFDTKTGWSKNISGVYCPPEDLDADGYRVRL